MFEVFFAIFRFIFLMVILGLFAWTLVEAFIALIDIRNLLKEITLELHKRNKRNT